MAKRSFWKMAGISLAIALVFTGCDDVLTQLKDEIKLGQQTKQEKLDFSLVLENTVPEARYSAVIYGTDGAPLAGAEGTPLADDSVVFAFLVLPGEYDLKITEKAGSVKTAKTDSVVFVDGLPKVVIGWDGLLEADAGEAVTDVSDEEEAVADDSEETAEEAVEETDTEEEAVTEEPEAVEETDTEEEAVAEEPEAVEETDTEEEAVTEEPEAVEETDTEEEAVEEPAEELEPDFINITMSPLANYQFPWTVPGYSPQAPLTLTVRNQRNQPTGNLSITIRSINNNHATGAFVLSNDSIPSIPANGTATFTITPADGLGEGDYRERVMVVRTNGMAGFTYCDVSFAVTAATYGITL